MCAQYRVLSEQDIAEMREIINEINKRFGYTASGIVRPTDRAPVIGTGGEPRAARFGFPHWQGKGVIYNARCESAPDKTMFRGPLRERRVAVPSAGFYEWLHVAGQKKKDRYLITRPNDDMLYMAGIAGTFRGADGQPYEAFTILTTDAVGAVAEIHDRQPVILDRDELELWCSNDHHIREVLTRRGTECLLRAG